MVLLRVAFITLLERKVLGYIQLRKGPNKVGFYGLFQPFSDAIKLFTKEMEDLLIYNWLIHVLAPGLGLFLILLFWCCLPWMGELLTKQDLIYVMAISRIGLYVILFSGWSSNRKYRLIGSYRGVAQTISYEVRLSFIILSLVILVGGFSLVELINFQETYIILFGYYVLFFLWLVTILAETNRTPFDFSEGESELVSGFNVEYGAGGFAVLFIAEYGNIIFISCLTSIIFFGGVGFINLLSIIIIIIFLWVRGTLARFRYDNLIIIAWRVILPFSLMYFILMFIIVIFY